MGEREARVETELDRFVFLTVRQYADLRNVTTRTVRRWITRRLVDASRSGEGGHWRIRLPRASR